jgi:hypothetical protein
MLHGAHSKWCKLETPKEIHVSLLIRRQRARVSKGKSHSYIHTRLAPPNTGLSLAVHVRNCMNMQCLKKAKSCPKPSHPVHHYKILVPENLKIECCPPCLQNVNIRNITSKHLETIEVDVVMRCPMDRQSYQQGSHFQQRPQTAD